MSLFFGYQLILKVLDLYILARYNILKILDQLILEPTLISFYFWTLLNDWVHFLLFFVYFFNQI